MKDYERIIYYLQRQNSRTATYGFEEIIQNEFNGDESKFLDALHHLRNSGLVKAHLDPQGIIDHGHMKLTDAGWSYFIEKKESQQEKRSDIFWRIVVGIVSGSSGVIIGYFLPYFF